MPVQAMAGEPPQCAPAHPQYQLGYPPQGYSAAGYPASQGYSPAGYPSLLDMQRDGSVTPCSYASTGYLPGSVPVAVTASPMSLTVVQARQFSSEL
ncbi:hypothetical protein BaRGS_00001131 [Batillaria attramentaria]|uniref:Uncharacterized protein n=1 Tax=Batillaria attramentaria TaxID=370345 RepID=A0ABD0M759_9CAEN